MIRAQLIRFSLTLLLVWRFSLLAADSLPRSSPEAQGVSSAQVRAFVEAADKQVDTMHSFMLVRHGHVIARMVETGSCRQAARHAFFEQELHLDGGRTCHRRR